MTQEQKAKAYDEALERAKEMIKAMTNIGGVAKVDDIQYLFPELAGSEDERMINGLQGFLSAFGSDYFGTDGWQKFDDWLEKQKEQKPAGGKELLYVSNKSYNIGYRDGKREAEQKSAEWSENDTAFLNEITDFFENKTVRLQHDLDMYAHWLKSLRPTHWKPSKEQMYSLSSVVNGAGEATEGSTAYHLKELYEQLKKL